MDNFRSMNFFNSGGWALLIFGANQNSSEIKILIECMKFFIYLFLYVWLKTKSFTVTIALSKSQTWPKNMRGLGLNEDIAQSKMTSKNVKNVQNTNVWKKRKINFDIQKWHFRCHPMVLGLNVALAGKINFATSWVNKCPVIRLF